MRDIEHEIRQKLQDIEAAEQVTILYAVESGSRAWGFASPDSDYDVRFIYVRPMEQYLMLNEARDVIEWQLDDVLDINGWDLKKALKQFHRSNATLFEWSNSPIVYKTTALWEQVYETAEAYFSVKAAAYHYYGTANSTYHQYLQEDIVNYKKYFYALRPLLAGQYIRRHECPPPVLFSDLLTADLPDRLHRGIDELLEIKQRSDEHAAGEQMPVIQDFIRTEIDRQKAYLKTVPDDRTGDWSHLNEIFRFCLEHALDETSFSK